MKKYLLPILTTTLCLTATGAFAQKKGLVKELIDGLSFKTPSAVSAQVERQLAHSTLNVQLEKQLAQQVAGEYHPVREYTLPFQKSEKNLNFLQLLNKTKEENQVSHSSMKKQSTYIVFEWMGFHVPPGTTFMRALENKVAYVAQKKNLNLSRRDVRLVAHNPELLFKLNEETEQAIFKTPLLSYREGLTILKANQAKFAIARNNNTYEKIWAEFIKTKEQERPVFDEKYYDGFGGTQDVAHDIYAFYVKHIGLEGLPRVRLMDISEQEGVVLEIPVNGLVCTSSTSLTHCCVHILPEKFVVIGYSNGQSELVSRSLLEMEENERVCVYRVIK